VKTYLCLIVLAVLAFTAGPASAQCPGLSDNLKPVSFEKVTVSTVAVGLTVATAGNAVVAIIDVEDAALRLRADASPTAVTGTPAEKGKVIFVCGATAIAGVKFIRRDRTDATLQVAYFKK
jgi:hypothetical protein